jgi:hypothetical protein
VLAQGRLQRGKLLDGHPHHRDFNRAPLLLDHHHKRGEGEDGGRSTLLMQDLIHGPSQGP